MKILKRIAPRAKGIQASAIDLGMTTAEYAVGTVAAVAFATANKPTRSHVPIQLVAGLMSHGVDTWR